MEASCLPDVVGVCDIWPPPEADIVGVGSRDLLREAGSWQIQLGPGCSGVVVVVGWWWLVVVVVMVMVVVVVVVVAQGCSHRTKASSDVVTHVELQEEGQHDSEEGPGTATVDLGDGCQCEGDGQSG